MQPLQRARLATSVFFFVNGAVVGCWVPFIPERAHSLGMSAGRLGTVLLGAGFGAVIAMPLAGSLIPRLGSRLMSIVGGLLFASALFLNVLTPTRTLLLLALIGYGVAGASMDVSMNAQAVLVERRLGRRILASLHGLFSLGNVVGSFGISAALGRHVPMRPLAGAVAAVLVFAVALSGPLMIREETQSVGKTGRRRSLDRRLVLVGALVVIAMICEGGTADWSGIYLRSGRGLGPGWAGVGFGVFATLMLTGRLLGDVLTGRLGELRTLRWGGIVGTLGALLVIYGPGRAGSLLGFALFGAGLANFSPVLYRAAGQVPGIPAGVGLATAVGMGYVGLLAGPPMLGGIAQALGLRTIFLVMAALCVLVSLAASLGAKTGASARPAPADEGAPEAVDA